MPSESETCPLAQRGVVLGPVRHPVPLLGDVMTATGIGFEWRSRNLGQKPNRLLRYPAAVTNSPIHATRRRGSAKFAVTRRLPPSASLSDRGAQRNALPMLVQPIDYFSAQISQKFA